MSYSKEQQTKALELYYQCKSVFKTVCILGYPTREWLYAWIKNENIPRKPRKNSHCLLILWSILIPHQLKLN